jgi:hypothetical protein
MMRLNQINIAGAERNGSVKDSSVKIAFSVYYAARVVAEGRVAGALRIIRSGVAFDSFESL